MTSPHPEHCGGGGGGGSGDLMKPPEFFVVMSIFLKRGLVITNNTLQK